MIVTETYSLGPRDNETVLIIYGLQYFQGSLGFLVFVYNILFLKSNIRQHITNQNSKSISLDKDFIHNDEHVNAFKLRTPSTSLPHYAHVHVNQGLPTVSTVSQVKINNSDTRFFGCGVYKQVFVNYNISFNFNRNIQISKTIFPIIRINKALLIK